LLLQRNFRRVRRDVSAESNGTIRVRNVDAAVDCGFAVNPDSVKAMIEGGANFGLAAALSGEITIANGAVQQTNFDTTALYACPTPPKFPSNSEHQRRPRRTRRARRPTHRPAVANPSSPPRQTHPQTPHRAAWRLMCATHGNAHLRREFANSCVASCGGGSEAPLGFLPNHRNVLRARRGIGLKSGFAGRQQHVRRRAL